MVTEKPPYSKLPEPMDPAVPRKADPESSRREVIIIGGGLAGLSAAIYLARALRDVLVIDACESLAMWEPEVQNYLGFPEGIDGKELLKRGRTQAECYGAEIFHEEIETAHKEGELFVLCGKKNQFQTGRLLLATGLYHLPPKIPAVNECLGKSMFFCKDCDGFRVQGHKIVIVGRNDDAVEYALGMLSFTSCVMIATNGQEPHWSKQHGDWIREYNIPVYSEKITQVDHENGCVQALAFEDGPRVAVDSLFTTRGDIFHNSIARQLGAELDSEGQVITDQCLRASVEGLYAAGCVTPANCQMIIAAGQGAAAAQAINRDLFELSLRNHTLLRRRNHQLRAEKTEPEIITTGEKL